MSMCLRNASGRMALSKINALPSIINLKEVLVTAVSFRATAAKDSKRSRQIHTVKKTYNAVGKLSPGQNLDWDSAVSEAQQVVGCHTSVLELRSLLRDERGNVLVQMEKLEGVNHPLLKVIEAYSGRNSMQSWGLILLLISKAIGNVNVDKVENDKAADVSHSQQALAKVIEMIHTGYLVHNSLFVINPGLDPEPSFLEDVAYGNKTALFSGDYLLATANKDLATLGNHDLMYLMSCAVRDLAEAEFHGRRDKQNMPLPSVEDALNPIEDWTTRNVLSSGSLLGKGCQGTLLLAGQSDQLQQKAYEFGMHLALAWQAGIDLEPFQPGSKYIPGTTFNLTSAPVMFHLEQDPSLFTEIDKGEESVFDVDFVTVHKIVSKGPGVESTKRLQKKHSQKAMEALEVFGESDARTALSNIIEAMGRFNKRSIINTQSKFMVHN